MAIYWQHGDKYLAKDSPVIILLLVRIMEIAWMGFLYYNYLFINGLICWLNSGQALMLKLPKEQREKVGKASIEQIREFVPYTKGRIAKNVS